MSYIPFNMRKFTLDGDPCNIEDFISFNSNSFEEARIMREDLMELKVDYHMTFKFNGLKTAREIYRVS